MRLLFLIVLLVFVKAAFSATTVIVRPGDPAPVYNTMDHQQPGVADYYHNLQKQQGDEERGRYYRNRNIFYRLFHGDS